MATFKLQNVNAQHVLHQQSCTPFF